jgi:hypothetical protein
VAGPRFRLVPGTTWSAARVLGGRTSSATRSGVGWRLLGPNNRELGRAAQSYPDAESALEAVVRIRRLAVEGEAHLEHDLRARRWTWHLDDQGVPLARSGRGFRLERECRHNLEQFRREAPGAPTATAPGRAPRRPRPGEGASASARG